MNNICLQNKTKCLKGIIESYWFENEFAGLQRTLFHRIDIPLAPFDSGLDYVDQPEDTSIVIEWLKLGLSNPSELQNLELNSFNHPDLECSIYLGSAHNECKVKMLKLTHINNNEYYIDGILDVDLEQGGIGPNESFNFKTIVEFVGEK